MKGGRILRSSIRKKLKSCEESQKQNDKHELKKLVIKNEWRQQMLSETYIPERIVGRAKQRQYIEQFVRNSIMNKINCKVLYISGVPGVGKTALTKQILTKIQKQTNGQFNVSYINCLTLVKPSHIYHVINRIFNPEKKDKTKSKRQPSAVASIQNYLKTMSSTHIIVIDQVDFLVTSDQKIFYNLFQWSYQTTTKLCFVLIANTMDFPQRLSPKIQSRMGDYRIVFKSYTQQQIKEVIDDRLRNCPIFAEGALTFASKKLATYSSDIRLILQVLRKAVQIYKTNNKKISIEVIFNLWKQKIGDNEETEQQIQKTLHDIVIEFLQKQGGSCDSKLLSIFLKQLDVQAANVPIILQELKQMGLIKMNKICIEGLQYYNIILLKRQ